MITVPGGPEVGSPQSYTGFEPSTLRAKRHDYDPYRIVRDRLTRVMDPEIRAVPSTLSPAARSTSTVWRSLSRASHPVVSFA